MSPFSLNAEGGIFVCACIPFACTNLLQKFCRHNQAGDSLDCEFI